MTPPTLDALTGDPDWLDVSLPHVATESTFVSGDPDGDRFRVRYFTDGAGALLTRTWFGPGTSGPPRHAHGGSQAALLDELAGSVAWINGHAVLAGELTVSFRAMLPVDTVVHGEAHVERVEGRKVFTVASLRSLNGETLYSEARGIFIVLDPSRTGDAPHKLAAQMRQTYLTQPHTD